MSSTVVIKKNGTDISNKVLFETARFTALANAVPGPFEFTAKDPSQVLSFTTGDEITVDIDGVRMYGGYVMQVGRGHAFPADNTVPSGSYDSRFWEISGVDYNILFDKRVIRNTANYLSNDFAIFAGNLFDGDLLTTLLDSYTDQPAGFDTATFMDNVTTPVPGGSASKDGAYMQQGTKIREQFERFAIWSGAVWYIDPNKKYHWHALENVVQRWGFSDQPNNATISSAAGFQNAYYGYREVEATEDGSPIANDALIWGGSQWAGAGSTVFSREQNSASITEHGRWQLAEAHFGEDGFGIQAGVDARADAIVNGPPGADSLGQLKGLRYSQWSFRFAWFAHDVPLLLGVPNHITVSSLVYINMAVFGVTKILPCRSLTMTFVQLNPAFSPSRAWVRFDGEFNLNITDPFTLWRFLLNRQQRLLPPAPLVVVSSTSASTVYGALFQGVPTPVPDGANTLFTISFGYIAGTTVVYQNGLALIRGSAYTESNPETGQITISPAPGAGASLWVICNTLGQV